MWFKGLYVKCIVRDRSIKTIHIAVHVVLLYTHFGTCKRIVYNTKVSKPLFEPVSRHSCTKPRMR